MQWVVPRPRRKSNFKVLNHHINSINEAKPFWTYSLSLQLGRGASVQKQDFISCTLSPKVLNGHYIKEDKGILCKMWFKEGSVIPLIDMALCLSSTLGKYATDIRVPNASLVFWAYCVYHKISSSGIKMVVLWRNHEMICKWLVYESNTSLVSLRAFCESTHPSMHWIWSNFWGAMMSSDSYIQKALL